MDDDALCCSELVHKGFYAATKEKLGELVKSGDLDWKPYKRTIEKYKNGPVPLDRAMITPNHLARVNQIVKIFGFNL